MDTYKKKYEEALEKAKHYTWYSTNQSDIAEQIKNAVCNIFPELKESEDEKNERIRKALLEYFGEQCDMSNWNGVYGYEIYAWLKKQSKQKSTNKVEPKFKIRDWVVHDISDGRKVIR